MRAKIQGREAVRRYYQDKGVAKQYFSQRYDSLFGKLRNCSEIKSINEFLRAISPDKILDFGIGTGRVARELKHYNEGYGLDGSKEMLEEAKKYLPNWKLKVGDAFNCPFPNNLFDVIVTTRFIWHFNKKDREELFSVIHNKLREGGFLIFDFPNANVKRFVPFKEKIGKKRVFTKSWTVEEIKRELEENKFILEDISPIIFNPVIINKLSTYFSSKFLFVVKFILPILKKGEPYSYVVMARKLIR